MTAMLSGYRTHDKEKDPYPISPNDQQCESMADMLALALFAVDRSFTTGTDLVHECKNYIAMLDNTRNLDSVDLYDAGACYGYIDGITAGLTAMRVACPADVTLELWFGSTSSTWRNTQRL